MNPDSPPAFGWRDAVTVYFDRRFAKILLLGAISGFPWALIGSMLTLWLKEEGFSRSGIGLFGLVFAVYAFNLLWAPIVDSMRVPFFCSRFGQRRGWILAMQSVIAVGVWMLAATDPARSVWLVSLWAFVVALASATQDVAIDALRIELLARAESRKVGAGSACATAGWWFGFGGGGAIALFAVDALQTAGSQSHWQTAYALMSILVAAKSAALIFFVPESAAKARPQASAEASARPTLAAVAARAGALYAAPALSFLRRHGARAGLSLLAVIFFFKIGEAFLGRMSLVFYKEVGFSNTDIATYQKGLGTIVFCAAAFAGGVINARFGILRGLVVGGLLMSATNLLFALLAWHPEKWLFAIAVGADQITTAISTVAFVAFISQLCERAHTATQYAAFASLGNFSRTTLAASSGFLVDALGGDWPFFFVLTTAMVAPSLFLLFALRKRLSPLLGASGG